MNPFYKKHILFCTNQKPDGKQCCQNGNAEAMYFYAKQKIKDLGLHGEGKIQVSRTGCLGRCDVGPNILVYPEGEWHRYESQADVDAVIEKVCQ